MDLDRNALEAMSKDDLIKMLQQQAAQAPYPPATGRATNAKKQPEPEPEVEPVEEDLGPPPLPLSHPDKVKEQMLAIKENTCSNWQQPNIEGSPELFAMLADALPHNKRLQYLSMHRLGIDDSVMALCFPKTTLLPTVQYLALAYNDITDVGFGTLMNCILAGGLQSLEVLGMTNNKLEKVHEQGLVTVLAKGHCPSLRQIYFKGNNLTDECEAALDAANTKREARMGQLGRVIMYFNIKANLRPPPTKEEREAAAAAEAAKKSGDTSGVPVAA